MKVLLRNRAVVKLPIAGLILALSIISSNSAYSQRIDVSRFDVCYNKTKDFASCAVVKPPFDRLSRSNFFGGKLYVVFSVLLDQSDINFLKENGFLNFPIQIWKDGTKAKPNDLHIGQDDWDDNAVQLTNAVATNGFFAWPSHFWIGLYPSIKAVELLVTDWSGNQAYIGGSPARFPITFAK